MAASFVCSDQITEYRKSVRLWWLNFCPSLLLLLLGCQNYIDVSKTQADNTLKDLLRPQNVRIHQPYLG